MVLSWTSWSGFSLPAAPRCEGARHLRSSVGGKWDLWLLVKEGLGDVAWKEGVVVYQQLFACRVIFGDCFAAMDFFFFFFNCL